MEDEETGSVLFLDKEAILLYYKNCRLKGGSFSVPLW